MTDEDIIERIPNMSALVAGDIRLDYRCVYDPALSAPPAQSGIARLTVISAEFRPGGGGSLAADLAALGCGRVAVLGVAGSDGHGFELHNSLRERGVSTENLVRTPEMMTFTSMRFFSSQTGAEDEPAIDFMSTRRLPETVERQILNRYQSVFDGFNLIYISDLAETELGGVVTDSMRKLIDELAPAYPDKIVIVDSRARLLKYRRVIIRATHRQADAASIELLGRIDHAALRERLRARLLVVTHEGQGVSVYDARGKVEVAAASPPAAGNRADDAFGAAFGLALAVSRDVMRATEFGNLVAAISAARHGEGVARPHEILRRSR